MPDALSSMIDALALEIAAIRKRGGGSQIELRGGERIGVADGSWLYRFLVANDLALRDETPVRITCGQHDASGVVVSFREGVLIVAVEEDLGPKIAAARLVTNDSFLVERLKDRLGRVGAGEIQFNRQSGERVIGRQQTKCGDGEPAPSILVGDPLNPDQLGAVRRALGSDTTYVWGPPGTGKTTTVARIVEAHYRAGRSVLVVSNTNIAVDTVLQKIADRLKGDPAFYEGLVLRQGPVVKEELRQQFGPQVIVDEIVARLGESLRQERERLARDADPLEREERWLLSAAADLERLYDLRDRRADTERQLAASQQQVGARERQADEQRTRAVGLRQELVRAQNMSVLRRFFTGANPERLSRDLHAADRMAQSNQDAAAALRGESAELEQRLAALRADEVQQSDRTRDYPSLAELRSRLESVKFRLKTISDRVATIDSELGALEQQVLARCRILATTVYRTYLGRSPQRQFDVVVIDEASMLMLPLVYYAAGLATHSVVVAGDFRQLPPIVVSDEPQAEEWLKRDVFEKAGIPERIERRQSTPSLVPLTTQYRMREPICAVINRLFYPDHPLRTDGSAAQSADDFPLGTKPLLYVDTARMHPWTAVRVGSFSRYNLLHALLVRNIVLHLAEAGYIPPAGATNEVIGTIAPYSAQARLTQALLSDRLGDRAAGMSATVHRFQGNEKKAIIIDLTDSLGAPLSRFLRATHKNEDGSRLLNVAASRAKHRVVLLGNMDFLKAKAANGAIVRQLVDHFEEHGEALDVHRLLPLAERDWIDGLHRVLPPTFELPVGAAGAFTEGTFYPAFGQDLLRARASIVILSPYATRAGTARWTDAIRVALGRGVRIRVLTRPPEEPGGAAEPEAHEAIRGLRDLGATVELRARMHEKIAVIDDRVLWHGSLNILSHRDTHESMLRIDSPAACAQLAGFLTSPQRGRETPSLFEPENLACPLCGGPTIWNTGRFGVYFTCEARGCSGKADGKAQRASRSGLARGHRRRGEPSGPQRPAVPGACPRSGCGGRLVERSGRFGRFLGCSRWPGCDYTEDA